MATALNMTMKLKQDAASQAKLAGLGQMIAGPVVGMFSAPTTRMRNMAWNVGFNTALAAG